MKKRIFLSLILINIIFYSFNVWAAKDEKEFGVHVRTKYGVKDVVEGSVDTETGEHVVKLEEGKLEIRVSGIVDETAKLMVMPINKKKKEVWAWLQSITKEIGENKSAYDIFFVNEMGDRIEVGEGSQVSVISNVKTQKVSVYYITDKGEHSALKSIIEEYVVKFNMVRNGYYTLLVQNGKNQIGTGIEKGDDAITPTDDEDEKEESEEAEPEVDGGNEIINEDVSNSEQEKIAQTTTKNNFDSIWLIIMIVIILITVVLFVIIFIKKKKEKVE